MVTSAGLLAAQGPGNVLVVVNRNASISRQVGDYYVGRRMIPKAQVCEIRTSVEDTISPEAYQAEIEQPIGRCLDSLVLAPKPIHYMVTTMGMPLQVGGSSGLEGTKAAVDSELAALYARRRGRALPLDAFRILSSGRLPPALTRLTLRCTWWCVWVPMNSGPFSE